MHVTFGLTLDGHRGGTRTNSFASATLGRNGFLGLLETYLGLSRPPLSVARRVATYLGYLRQCDDGQQFYSKTLRVDSLGAAAKLLAWRDELRLAGWDGRASADVPRRLRELAQVEALSAGLPPGEPERVHAVTAALATGPTPITSIVLVDPTDSFPTAWQQLLKALPGVKEWQPEPQGEGYLRELQEQALQAVLEGSVLNREVRSALDGSVQLFATSTHEAAEHWLSARCTTQPADQLFLCESGGDAVDTTLMASGGVCSGFENPSELRPALQAAALALEMCWEPVDAGKLMEFLVHPVGPFSRSARSVLSKALAEQPGIGGEYWVNARNTLAALEGGESLSQEVDFWLQGERWSRDTGAPLDQIALRIGKLQESHRRRLANPDAIATFGPAYEQCSAILEGLKELESQQIATLVPRQLEQLIGHATPVGARNPRANAQVGCMRSSTSPATCIDPADEVIWWMPASPSLPAESPWTPMEKDALRKMGVSLSDPQQRLRLLGQQWLRPLLAARKRFCLVLPPSGTEEHPFRQLLARLAPGLLDSQLSIEPDAAHVGALAFEVTRVELPETPQYIALEKPIALPKEGLSYTSLTELYNNPALFGLKRAARLKATNVLSAEENNRLLGTLAHRFIEELFQDPEALTKSNDEAIVWFRTRVESLLEAEGAPLLMQGAGLSLQRFKSICEGAICSLLDHLRAAGVIECRTEVEVDGTLGPVGLTGKVDLLVKLLDGRYVAFDMKWRGDKKYASLLLDGKHLQLALYATLLHQKLSITPAAVGYFIFESGAVYITSSDLFPAAQVRVPKGGVTVANLLDGAKESWKWRASQWNHGQIEVVRDADLKDYQTPEGALAVEKLGPWHEDFLVLLGGWDK